jgi:hypothetical protein
VHAIAGFFAAPILKNPERAGLRLVIDNTESA